MSFKDEISFEQIQELVNYALESFYTNDAILLDYKTEDTAVSERCMVFHIGRYMIEKMKSFPCLIEANLDCEYNRNFSHPKGMYKATREKTKDVIPDLIIHKRKSNRDNLLIIEFKKGKPSKALKQGDIEKLEYFTDAEKEYKYKFGLYIELYKSNSAKIEVYQSGKVIGHLCHTWNKL